MGLGFAVCLVSFVACFFNLVCDPKLILQISGTFQQSCRELHRKTKEADNAVKVVLSKLSSCCDELGKFDLDDSTLKTCVAKWLHRWKLLSGVRWKYQDSEYGPLLLKLQHIF